MDAHDPSNRFDLISGGFAPWLVQAFCTCFIWLAPISLPGWRTSIGLSAAMWCIVEQYRKYRKDRKYRKYMKYRNYRKG